MERVKRSGAAYSLSVDSATHNIYAAGGGGVYVSSDNGTTWNSLSTGLANTYPYTILANGGNLYVGTDEDGVFLSTNHGQSWTPINEGLESLWVISLAVCGDYLFADTYSYETYPMYRRPLSEILPHPLIQITNDSITFTATMGSNQTYFDTISISNAGTGALTLASYTSSYAPVTITDLSTPATILPGANGGLIVQLDYQSQPSAHSYLMISTNDPKHPVDTIFVTVRVLPVPPQIHIENGTIQFTVTPGVNQSLCDTIRITDIGKGVLQLTGDSSSVPPIYCALGSIPATLQPGDTLDVPVVFDYESQNIVRAMLYMKSNDPAHPVDSVLVIISINTLTPNILLSPDTIVFNLRVGCNQTLYDSVRITNAGTGALSLKSDSLSFPSLYCTEPVMPETIEPGNLLNVILAYDYESQQAADATLTFTTNDSRHLDDTVFIVMKAIPEYVAESAPDYFVCSIFPNPFSSSTTIDFTLQSSANVILKVYNELGEEIVTLVNSTQVAGTHSVLFRGDNLPNGVYFYRLTAGMNAQTGRMAVVR